MAVIYRKYRSQTFNEIVGQQVVVEILKNQIVSDTLPHALLFTGPRGTGKTSLARIVSKALNCLKRQEDGNPCNLIDPCANCFAISNGNFEDLIEIDAASNRGIEEMRSLKENINLLPLRSTHKIYIIDEAHMLTREAFNALLKVLEEPPKHVIFMLCTTESTKILPTIISRCEKLELTLATEDILLSKLQYICQKESVEIDQEGLKVLIELSGGSFRDSESLLEKVFSYVVGQNDKKIDEKQIRTILGVPSGEAIRGLIEGLQTKNAAKCLDYMDQVSNLSPFDFIKILLSELIKDFEKNNQIIKLVLQIDQDIKFTQFGYIVMKSKIIEWCNLDSLIISTKPIQPEIVVKTIMPKVTIVEKDQVKPVTTKNIVTDKNFETNWRSMIESIGVKNKPLKFILNASKATLIENTISLKVLIKLHKDLLEKKTAKDLITEAYMNIYGEPPLINIYLEGEAKKVKSENDIDLESIFNS